MLFYDLYIVYAAGQKEPHVLRRQPLAGNGYRDGRGTGGRRRRRGRGRLRSTRSRAHAERGGLLANLCKPQPPAGRGGGRAARAGTKPSKAALDAPQIGLGVVRREHEHEIVPVGELALRAMAAQRVRELAAGVSGAERGYGEAQRVARLHGHSERSTAGS